MENGAQAGAAAAHEAAAAEAERAAGPLFASAVAWRNSIAQRMWDDYLVVLANRAGAADIHAAADEFDDDLDFDD